MYQLVRLEISGDKLNWRVNDAIYNFDWKRRNQLWSYIPDLPGCVAVGETIEEVRALIQEAIEFHLEWMREEGLPIPEATTHAEYIEV